MKKALLLSTSCSSLCMIVSGACHSIERSEYTPESCIFYLATIISTLSCLCAHEYTNKPAPTNHLVKGASLLCEAIVPTLLNVIFIQSTEEIPPSPLISLYKSSLQLLASLSELSDGRACLTSSSHIKKSPTIFSTLFDCCGDITSQFDILSIVKSLSPPLQRSIFRDNKDLAEMISLHDDKDEFDKQQERLAAYNARRGNTSMYVTVVQGIQPPQ